MHRCHWLNWKAVRCPSCHWGQGRPNALSWQQECELWEAAWLVGPSGMWGLVLQGGAAAQTPGRPRGFDTWVTSAYVIVIPWKTLLLLKNCNTSVWD